MYSCTGESIVGLESCHPVLEMTKEPLTKLRPGSPGFSDAKLLSTFVVQKDFLALHQRYISLATKGEASTYLYSQAQVPFSVSYTKIVQVGNGTLLASLMVSTKGNTKVEAKVLKIRITFSETYPPLHRL
jgi:hypothetical protein